ncbi:MAG: HNH endonuclease [Gammaproteobacteria bacterium]
MSGIFIFTADTAEARKSLSASIEERIPRDRVIGNFSDTTYAELLQIENNTQGFYAWGVPPGPINIMNWLYMSNGDMVLGEVDGVYRYAAEVVGRYENPRAAKAIWGTDPDSGDSREYIFFLTQPVQISVPVGQLKDWLSDKHEPFTRVDDKYLQAIRSDFGTLKHFIAENVMQREQKGPSLDISGIFKTVEDTATATGIFQAVSVTDSRTRHFEAIIRRRGHPRFRQALIKSYGGKCAISRCEAEDVLEAALISPFQGDKTYHVSNGLLLRSDLHTLFDLGHIAIDSTTMRLLLAKPLLNSTYKVLDGRRLTLPERPELAPSVDALDAHRMTWGL